MSVSGAQYQLQIQTLRQEKSQTEGEIKGLADRSSEWQLKVYRLMLVINAEIANKHFKEVNSDLLLPNRISSAVALMENEIHRLEVGMDMTGDVDVEFDSCLEKLKTNIEAWNEMQNEIRSPILTSTLYTKSMEVLERHGKDEFPNADKVTLVDDAAFLEQATRQGESIQSIVATSEVAMADQAMFFDQALEDNVQRVVRGMDAQCLETKQHFEDERDARIDLLDAMYQDLLAKFLADTEQSSLKFKDLYAAMEHKKREEDLVSVATHGSATHNSWKTELDNKMRHTLQAEQQARALEAQLDSLLLNELDESTISVLPHGMDDGYLQVLMDKLTDLYLESSEIRLKQLRMTS